MAREILRHDKTGKVCGEYDPKAEFLIVQDRRQTAVFDLGTMRRKAQSGQKPASEGKLEE